MNRRQLIIYWIGIVSVLIPVELFHFYNYFNQPSLGEYYTGKTVVYSAFIFTLCVLIFFGRNIYSFVVCLKNKQFSSWVSNIFSGIVFLFLSTVALSKISEAFYPLDVWEQSTLKKLQRERESK